MELQIPLNCSNVRREGVSRLLYPFLPFSSINGPLIVSFVIPEELIGNDVTTWIHNKNIYLKVPALLRSIPQVMMADVDGFCSISH